MSLGLAGCTSSVTRIAGGDDAAGPVGKPDLSWPDEPDMTDPGGGGGDDMAGLPGVDNCGDNPRDPACQEWNVGPPDVPFPLSGDPMKDPLEKDNGLSRDPTTGELRLDSTHSSFNYLWVANSSDLAGDGTVSKLDSKTVREVARYRTVTCYSNKGGSVDACDGTKGCCSVDDWQRYQARKMKVNPPGHQQVQKTQNSPSRTSVDFNGDLFISNRAFSGQSSVTHIANDVASCVDRNRNGKIETSKDSNGDGYIEVDCNADGAPDNLASVKAKACTNGLPPEFYGEDDECILWTSNTFPPNAIGRPLGLAQGANDANVSDAWAGSFSNGNFVRIDGTSGLDKDDAQLPQECYGGSGPYGLAVDASGIGWTPDLFTGKLCYFDTKNSKNVGSVRDPQWGPMEGYGVTMDRDQNVWVGAGVLRYTPDRSNGVKNLGNGWWTRLGHVSGARGIAADSRTANAYFVYSCQGGLVKQIPASTIKLAKMDQQIPDPGWPTINMPCYGVGVDSDQNVWGVPNGGGWTTRALVDKMGNFKQPSVGGPPMGNNVCPAGDSCKNDGAYTYSDFTGFGLRNFTRPQGTYSYYVKGCVDGNNTPVDTQWYQVVWDADVPPNTSLTVHARAGHSLNPADPSWTANPWSDDAGITPLDLQATLTPNWTPQTPQGATLGNEFLLVEFTFKTAAQNATPRLRSFGVGFKCMAGPG